MEKSLSEESLKVKQKLHISALLRGRREELGFNAQGDLAKIVFPESKGEYGPQTKWSRLENGIREPKTSEVIQLSKGLKLPILAFFIEEALGMETGDGKTGEAVRSLNKKAAERFPILKIILDAANDGEDALLAFAVKEMNRKIEELGIGQGEKKTADNPSEIAVGEE